MHGVAAVHAFQGAVKAFQGARTDVNYGRSVAAGSSSATAARSCGQSTASSTLWLRSTLGAPVNYLARHGIAKMSDLSVDLR